MGLHSYFSCIVYIFLLATLASASPFLSDDIFESGASTGRSLLQAKKIAVSTLRIRTTQSSQANVKGPNTHPSYINVFGKYPPGLFANQCKEGKQGLDCSQVAAPPPSNSGQVATLPSLLLITTAGFLVFFFHLF